MRSRDGFALVAALWVVVAVGAVGLDWGLRARMQRLATANAVESATARAAAESGLALARARLERVLVGSAAGMDPWHDPAALLGDSVHARAGVRYLIRVSDLGTRLNLNRASQEELRRLLVALRLDAGRADRIAQSAADWRDADDLHRARGAERIWYLRAGSDALPRNGPFQSVEELRHVREMTPELMDRLRPYLTVRGSGRINLSAAPTPVLRTLPGLGGEAVATIEGERSRTGRAPDLSTLPRLLSGAARAELLPNLPRLLSMTTAETQELEVISDGFIHGSPVRARLEAVVVRSGGTAYQVWSRIE